MTIKNLSPDCSGLRLLRRSKGSEVPFLSMSSVVRCYTVLQPTQPDHLYL